MASHNTHLLLTPDTCPVWDHRGALLSSSETQVAKAASPHRLLGGELVSQALAFKASTRKWHILPLLTFHCPNQGTWQWLRFKEVEKHSPAMCPGGEKNWMFVTSPNNEHSGGARTRILPGRLQRSCHYHSTGTITVKKIHGQCTEGDSVQNSLVT